MARSLSQKIEFVFAELKRLGINVNPTSRLPQLARPFQADDGSWARNVPRADSQWDFALEAWREFQLFEFILDPWSFAGDEVAMEKLQVAANKDQPPQYSQPKGETRGRDTQVELFIATAFRRSGAGAELVRPPPGRKWPDIRTRACNSHFFIEAKRVKSARAVVDAIEDAVEQVNATGCPGAAYVDVTMAFNETNTPPNEHLRLDQVDVAFRAWFKGKFEPLRAEVDEAMRGSRMTTLFLQCHYLMAIAGELDLRSWIEIYPGTITGRYARQTRDVIRTLRQQMMKERTQ